jgi:hypothetical protein
MSQAIIGDQVWAEMTDGQKTEAVSNGHATLKQMSEGLLDGSEELRRACQERLAHTTSGFENLPVEPETDTNLKRPSPSQAKARRRKVTKQISAGPFKQRFGLPDGFAPRWQRYDRSVLLELNVYRLPNGSEFIPSPPTGTLGARQHLYALLTVDQYLNGKRGSVYVRTDDRIFDYSCDNGDPTGDIFDTGFTIHDLERTGRYAPAKQHRKKKKKSVAPRYRQAAAG